MSLILTATAALPQLVQYARHTNRVEPRIAGDGAGYTVEIHPDGSECGRPGGCRFGHTLHSGDACPAGCACERPGHDSMCCADPATCRAHAAQESDLVQFDPPFYAPIAAVQQALVSAAIPNVRRYQLVCQPAADPVRQAAGAMLCQGLYVYTDQAPVGVFAHVGLDGLHLSKLAAALGTLAAADPVR